MTQAANLGALGTNAGTTGILASTGGGTGTTAGVTGFKNRIINGAMVINQRNGTTAQTNVNGFVTDRFQALNQSSGTINAQTVTTAPAGFTYSTKLTVGTADASVGAADSVIFYQALEGFSIAGLNWGTANAKVATISFWVYSSLTGNYSGSLVDQAGNYSFPFNYTISLANTWEQKSITIAAPTSGGTFGTINNVGVYLEFSLMTGTNFQGTANAWSVGNFRGTSSQVNWMATSGNTWFITGVQLEVGSTATSFDYRPYGTELALCQRYCNKLVYENTGAVVTGYVDSTTSARGAITFPTMRTSVSASASSASHFKLDNGSGAYVGTGILFDGLTPTSARMVLTSSGMTAGQGGIFLSVNNSAFILLTAEL